MTETTTAAPALLARLERIPTAWWHVRARMILGVATFFDAFDLLAISFALPALVGVWKMTPSQVGLVLSAAFVGQLLGAIVAGWAAERYGRLFVTTITIAIFSVMSLACAFAWDPNSLIAFRFLQGIGLGGEVPIATTYISELARAEGRGRFYILYELVFSFGLVAAGVIGYLIVPRIGWQSMFIVGAAPALIVFFLRRLLPESPRWLVSRGRLAEADDAIAGIERSVAGSGYALPPPLPAAAVPARAREATRWGEFLTGRYLKRSLTVWALWFCCFSTTYGLTSWLPTLYKTIFNLSLSHSLLYGMITNLTGICGSAICAFSIDRIGRRRWFGFAFLCGGATLLALWYVGPSTAVTLLVFVSLGAFFMSSVSIALNLYTPELYPTRIRAFASSVGGAWQRVAATIGPLVVAALVTPYGLGSVFLYFGGLAILGGVLAFLFGTETKGQILEELSP
jgi:putative MFS transporter